MHTRLSPLIRWPEREQLWETTRLSFRKHFSTKVAILIDCFEIFCDKPTNLLARSETFSTYKHHNTVKYLIGISPQGVISFISEGWGGRCSDKSLLKTVVSLRIFCQVMLYWQIVALTFRTLFPAIMQKSKSQILQKGRSSLPH